ncbi:MAG TPA: polymer-forming cytoskeletal protein [Phaeodactylibacter sp.]|nr:polymer-forming cytoskeletal protein [Phaeodactylibacter sp.]
MFGSKTKEKTKTNNQELSTNSNGMAQGTTCVIAPGTRIEGKFSTTENVRLDGVIVGEVSCDKRMVMGESGQVEGTIVTVDSAVKGKVKGEIKVSGTLHLHETATIDGTIIARKMVVDSGASYSGECKVGDHHFK